MGLLLYRMSTEWTSITKYNVTIVFNPYHTFMQLLFQAIKIYTVSRCTFKNYQNLPGIVNDATINSNRRTSISTKGTVHDKLPDVRTGTMIDSNRSYHTIHTSSHCKKDTTSYNISPLHTIFYHTMPHSITSYHTTPHHTTSHHTSPPLTTLLLSTPPRQEEHQGEHTRLSRYFQHVQSSRNSSASLGCLSFREGKRERRRK